MSVNIAKIASILNTVAAIGAALQAAGVLNMLGATGTAIAVAILAAVNAIAHALPNTTASVAPTA